MKIALAIITMLVVGIFAVPTKAQTYTTNTPFPCHGASLQQYWYETLKLDGFNCWGIEVYDDSGTPKATYYFNGQSANRFEVYIPGQNGFSVAYGTFIGTSFTDPKPGCTIAACAGKFEFTWSGPDTNGVQHSGSVSGEWVNYQICGGRGCQYWAPKLLSSALTLN
jgi:hypothetical protein